MVLNVAIIGSGFGGLGTAIRMRQNGISDVTIFERASDLGGTWRDNVYPGCRCDVASNLYSFSFAPNPEWTNTYSYQPEIQAYLQRVADEFQLRHLIKFDHEVQEVRFDEERSLWVLATSAGTYEARCVVMATGGLAEPRLPAISGIETFSGETMHTAKWNNDLDLAGKRVGVIGTGASAIQAVPEIAPIVGSLTVFQRTPSWILPHLGHPVKDRTKKIFSSLKSSQRLVRAWGYWRRELMVLGFVKDPRRMTKAETMSREHLERQIKDPVLREKFTPNYRLGCKRVLISNDFYRAFNRENVSLVTEDITAVEPTGIRASDGTLHELDVLITATGFFVTDNPMAEIVHGRGDAVLAGALRGSLVNYKGTTFPNFPNFFMLGGPNTALGHSSIIFMLESQLNYVVEAIGVALSNNTLVEPREDVATRWTSELRAKLPATVWGAGCSSWYLNAEGVNTTIWPDFTFKFRQATRKFTSDDHTLTAAVTAEN